MWCHVIFFYLQAADKLLIEPHGQTAMKVIHRFLAYNSEWLEKTLGVTVRGVDTLAEKPGVTEAMPVEMPKLVPWEGDIFRTPTPKEMVSHCCNVTFFSRFKLCFDG